ncbi:MAG: hypothetical protein KDB79_08200, partial [Acidobacteria bacterium]|nr:hypothetical protein [Acidobacteriota bacterium]
VTMKRRNELFQNIETVEDLNSEELALLFLIPLIQTAWVCKAVSPREKHEIYKAARKDAIDGRHEFNDVIDDFLKYQPGGDFFDHCLRLINDSLENMTVKERTRVKTKILSRCERVAASAGGKSLMDVNHHISEKEKQLLENLRAFLF